MVIARRHRIKWGANIRNNKETNYEKENSRNLRRGSSIGYCFLGRVDGFDQDEAESKRDE